MSDCIKRTYYKELCNSLTWSSSVVRNGSSSRTLFLPKSQGGSGVAAEERSGLYQRQGPVQTSTPGTINCGLFWRKWLAKSGTTTWTVWRDPSWKHWQRSPRDGTCWDSKWPERLKACVEAEGGIIINKNLKQLLINYLARNVDVPFHFPSRSQYLGQNVWQDRVQGRLAKIRTPELWNFNGHAAACVIAQQYSSPWIAALRIHPDKAKLGASFQHVISLFYFLKLHWPIPEAALSKAWVSGRSIAGTVGSKPAGAWMVVSCECCVLSGRGLCVGLITSLEKSYRLWCVWTWSWILDNEDLVH
jgi:hypothetical protein